MIAVLKKGSNLREEEGSMQFMGYRRPDGRVGIRNHILILPASVCASDTTRMIAAQLEGAVTFNNQNGCSQTQSDQKLTMDIMAGFAANPNIYGTIVVSLGCENCQASLVEEAIRERTCKPLRSFVIQENNGTLNTVRLAVAAGIEMLRDAAKVRREPCDISELILGTQCGGSDPTSGLSANLVIGEVSDRLVALGGTSVLTETSELIGAEHILAARAKTPEVARKIYDMIERTEVYIREIGGEDVRDSNPTLGNIESGITTLEEKSLGCIHKGGHAIINNVYGYAQQIEEKGLVIMDSSSHDPTCVAALVAGGCQVVIFSTGLGTPTGNPIAPVIKITGNRDTFRKMRDNTDFDTSGIMYGEKTVEESANELFDLMVEVANGAKPAAELLGFTEIAIDRVCNYT